MSPMEYGLDLHTLSNAQRNRLQRVQNKAMRIVLWCTRDTVFCLIEYARVVGMKDHPLLGLIKSRRNKGSRSWKAEAEAEDTVISLSDLDEVHKEGVWLRV